MEVESPVDASLEAVLAQEGAELPIGGALARLATEGESALAKAAEESDAETAVARAHAAKQPTVPTFDSTAPALRARILASPFAKRLAEINGIGLAGLAAAEEARPIRKRNALTALETRRAKVTPAPDAPPIPHLEPRS